MAHGSEPSPPASETWITISGDTAPAVGAWMMGCSMPRRSRSRASGHMGGVHRLGDNPLSYTPLNRAVEVLAAAADPRARQRKRLGRGASSLVFGGRSSAP